MTELSTFEKLVKCIRRTEAMLDLACNEIASTSGTCPYDMHDWKGCGYDSGCDSCGDVPGCWLDYFAEKVVGR